MRTLRTAAAAAVTTVVTLTPAAALAAPPTGAPGQDKPGHYSFAVIGDVPYGEAQIKAFPSWVDQISASDVKLTFHVGDIKNGSSVCSDDYYNLIKSNFDRFTMPFVYTPGDNEWTDCHRTNNGAYQPLERLAKLRGTFFAQPGMTLGQPIKVDSQAKLGLPENVRMRRDGVQFAVVHVVGSNNDLKPWTGIGLNQPTAEQVAEEQARMAASIANIRDAFAQARRHHDRAVALLLQADMFDPTYEPKPDDISAFKPLVQALIDESNCFDGQVYLFDGDSHKYNVDQPLAQGSTWLTTYGVTGSSNLTRITVDGDKNNVDWLKVTVNRPGADRVLSWQQVPYTN